MYLIRLKLNTKINLDQTVPNVETLTGYDPGQSLVS